MINFASWFTISKAHGWGEQSQNARLHLTITSFWAHYFGNAIILWLYSPPKYPHLGKGKIILCNMISKYTKKILTWFLQTANTQSWSSSRYPVMRFKQIPSHEVQVSLSLSQMFLSLHVGTFWELKGTKRVGPCMAHVSQEGLPQVPRFLV
jgi:hypothetical protein